MAIQQQPNAYAERAMYVLRCAEKERDELQHRIDHAAPNDALRFTGESMLKGFKEKINQARKNAENAGAVIDDPSANVRAEETSRIIRRQSTKL